MDPRDDLIARLATTLGTRFTKAGHFAQVVNHEHLGVCSVRGCAPSCIEARADLAAAVKHLETVALARPTQLRLEVG